MSNSFRNSQLCVLLMLVKVLGFVENCGVLECFIISSCNARGLSRYTRCLQAAVSVQ